MAKTFRYAINVICLALGIALSINFFYSLSDDRIFRAVVPVATIVIECLAQYILSMGRFNWKHGRRPRALALLFLYAWYLLVFALLSGMSYFTAEIAAREQAAEKVSYSIEVDRQKWQQNNTLIDTLSDQLRTESETGYGTRSRAIMSQVAALKAEQAALEERFQQAAKAAETTVAKVTDTFGALAAAFGVRANLLKVFVFGTVVLFVYLGLALTNWDINFEKPPEKRVSAVTPVTGHVTRNVTRRTITRGVSCPVCGTPLVKPRQRYCSNACKQKAFRERSKEVAVEG